MTPSDHDLLQSFARNGSQPAFAALVTRHLDLVYSVARRHLGSTSLAEDVAQSVFLDLARQAGRVPRDTPLIAWLHLVARRTAVDAIRRDARRRAREHAAAHLAAMPTNSLSPDWSAVEPLLDEAVESLPPADRTAILLRFFANKSLREVGASLGTSDDAAQKRVTRALDQLRAFFLRRGIPLSSAALAADLSAATLHAAPAALGTTIAAAATTALPALSVGAAHTFAMTTLQKTFLAGAFTLTAGAGLFEASVLHRQRSELAQVEADSRRLTAALDQSRAATTALVARFSSVEAEIDQRLARSRATASAQPADPALEQQIKAWLADAARLKEILAQRPDLATPELRLLSDEQWAEIAAQNPPGAGVDTETGLLHAAAIARQRAQHMVAGELRDALVAYLKVSADVLPDSFSQLQPHLKPSIALEMLSRYELIHTGKLSDVPPRDRSTSLIITRSRVDPERDTIVTIGAQGWATYSAESKHILERARRAMKR